MRDFDLWLSNFRSSIANYGYCINFDKVYRNVSDIKVELNILNSLIGSKNVEEDFKRIIAKYPETLKCIPILLAVRANEYTLLTAMVSYFIISKRLTVLSNNMRYLCAKRACLSCSKSISSTILLTMLPALKQVLMQTDAKIAADI